MKAELRERTVWLDVTSYRGYGGGIHYYGKMQYGPQSWPDKVPTKDLEYALSARQAAKMNRLDAAGYGGGIVAYHKGDMSWRFDTREGVIEKGKTEWKEFAPEAIMLVQASSSLAQPMEILAGLEDVQLEIINRVWQTYEDHVYGERPQGRWDQTTEDLEEEWDLFLEQYTKDKLK